MSKNTITQKEINELMNQSHVAVNEVFGKCTIVSLKMPNGFILTESSACVDPANYDVKMGEEICLKRIENRIWELEGYRLQEKMYQAKRQRP